MKVFETSGDIKDRREASKSLNEAYGLSGNRNVIARELVIDSNGALWADNVRIGGLKILDGGEVCLEVINKKAGRNSSAPKFIYVPLNTIKRMIEAEGNL